jgi:hypothetical protein
MAKFVALLYGEQSLYTDMSKADHDAAMAAHEAFSAKHGDAIVGGAELHLPAKARTVRDRGRRVTDGPFLETKEVLGGYYLIEAPDLDAAVEIARDIPEPTVEVRPVVP